MPGFEREEVELTRRKSGAAGVGGVLRCDSPWLCPTCAPRRAKQREERVREVIDAAHAMGGRCALVTLTIRHTRALPLREAKRLLGEGSRQARQGKAWTTAKDRAGILGVVQGVEVTHGRHSGWHYHAHAIVVATGSAEALLGACAGWVKRFVANVRRMGGDALADVQDVQLMACPEQAVAYASKGSASWEIAGGAKAARGKDSRSPWDLAALAAAGDEDARRLFAEYAEVMPGTRSCVVSWQLAEKLGVGAADDAEEPGEQDLDDEGEVVAVVSAPAWRRILGRSTAWQVLLAVEQRVPDADLQSLIRSLGAAPPPAPPQERRPGPDDVHRIVIGARARSGRGALDEAIEEWRRSVLRAGCKPVIDRREIERAFVRHGASAPLW